MKFFIIHGSYGNPEENWFSWLKKELEHLGHTVIVPQFPTPQGQSLDAWMETFEPYLEHIDSDTVFIGHSLGPAFILSLLETIKIHVKSCYFVSGFINLLGNETFDTINETFVTKPFDWDSIIKHCNKFVLFHSDNDPYVPIENGKELAKKLHTELIVIENARHFNFEKFPQLLKKITDLN